jgi:hypothetical protein
MSDREEMSGTFSQRNVLPKHREPGVPTFLRVAEATYRSDFLFREKLLRQLQSPSTKSKLLTTQSYAELK